MTEGTEIKLPRASKGKRPSFYKDPAVDRLFAVVTALTAEVSVLWDRVDTVERLLDRDGTVSRAQIEGYRPDDAVEAERTARRDAFIGRVFQVIHEEAEAARRQRE